MISSAFESLIKKSFRDSLEVAIGDGLKSTDGVNVRDIHDPQRIKGEQVIVLTISSHLFRVLIVMYFDLDEVFSRYLKACLGDNTKPGDSKTYDFLFEVGNLFCGTMKRDLQSALPSLGMSTPNLLKADALNHVRSLRLDQENYIELKYEGENLLFASYFLSAYGDLDVSKRTNADDDVDAGELEFF